MIPALLLAPPPVSRKDKRNSHGNKEGPGLSRQPGPCTIPIVSKTSCLTSIPSFRHRHPLSNPCQAVLLLESVIGDPARGTSSPPGNTEPTRQGRQRVGNGIERRTDATERIPLTLNPLGQVNGGVVIHLDVKRFLLCTDFYLYNRPNHAPSIVLPPPSSRWGSAVTARSSSSAGGHDRTAARRGSHVAYFPLLPVWPCRAVYSMIAPFRRYSFNCKPR